MSTKRTLVQTLGMLCLLALLAACGSDATPTTAPPAATSAPAATEVPEQPTEAPEVVIHYLTVQNEDEGWPLIIRCKPGRNRQLDEACL
jgi:predicted small lipoprotein YifL